MDHIRTILERYPEAKFGFIVYRCTYSDDDKWNRFMEYVTAQAKHGMDMHGVGDLFPRLDWCVQEDSNLDGASKWHVRDLFRRWIEDGEERIQITARHKACIMVDELCLESTIRELDERAREGVSIAEPEWFGVTWVNLISKNGDEFKGGSCYDSDCEELCSGSDREEEDHGDHEALKRRLEGLPQELYDRIQELVFAPKDEVTYAMVATSYLIPRTFAMLDAMCSWGEVFSPDDFISKP